MDLYPFKYRIPNKSQDYNGFIYSKGQVEELSEPNQLPNELSNNISISDYKDIIDKCNCHIEKLVFHRKGLSYCSFGIGLSFIFFFLLSLFYFKKLYLVFTSSIIFFVAIVILVIYAKKFFKKIDEKFNKEIEHLNYIYNSKGIQIVKRLELSKPTGWRYFLFKSTYLVRIFINYQLQNQTSITTPQLYSNTQIPNDANERTPLI